MKLSAVAEALGLERRGDDVEITGVAPTEEAGAGDLSFALDQKFLKQGAAAAALVIPEALAEAAGENPVLLSAAPAVDAGRAALLFGGRELGFEGVHASAVVDASAQLGEGVAVGPLAVIGPEVEIGPRTVVHPGAVIHDRTVIGADCVIQSNAVIGGIGFGYEFAGGRHTAIPHLGRVVIGDDVEVGACSTIDRARFGDTVIGNNVVIDNQVQIAHNVTVGDHTVIVSQAGLAGSCEIGPGAILAGRAAVVPHVKVGAGARIAAGSGVTKDVAAGATVAGFWAADHRTALVEMSAVRRLPAFMKKVEKFLKGQG